MMKRRHAFGAALALILAVAGATLLHAGEPAAAATPEEIRTLIKRLDHDSPDAREQAFQKLLDIGESALPSLEKAARDEASVERSERAGWLVGKIRKQLRARLCVERWNAVFTPELKAFVGRTVPEVVDRFLSSAEDWEELSDQEAQEIVKPLLLRSSRLDPLWRELLQDVHQGVRTQVLNYLAPLKEKSFIPDYVRLLKEPGLREQALSALQKIDDPEACRDAYGAILEQLEKEMTGGQRSSPQIYQFLMSCRDEVLRKVAETLYRDPLVPGRFGGASCTERGYGLIYLGHLDGEKRAEIRSALGGDAEDLTRAAIYLVGEQKWKAFVPDLARLLEKEETPVRVRCEAIYALQVMEAREALAAVTECLKSRHLQIRAQALQALIVIGDRACVPALMDVLRSRIHGRVGVLSTEGMKRELQGDYMSELFEEGDSAGAMQVLLGSGVQPLYGWTVTASLPTRVLCVRALEKVFGKTLSGTNLDRKMEAWKDWVGLNPEGGGLVRGIGVIQGK